MRPLLVAALLVCAPALAGDLNPPAGPVAPTMKRLAEIEPRTVLSQQTTPGDSESMFIINEPGSYYLARPLNPSVDRAGITVNADDVTIDLNGFSIVCNPLTVATVSGISLNGERVRVMNGTIRGFPGNGIATFGAVTVTDVEASENSTYGFFVSSRSVFTRCTAVGNGFDGFAAGFESTFTACAAVDNTLAGFNVSNECALVNCQANGNGGRGIDTNARCVVTGCAARGNGQDGIGVTDTSIVESCAASGNGGAGIATRFGSRVHGCVVEGNAGFGIDVLSGSIVSENVVTDCDGGGICVSSECRVIGNSCTENGDAAGVAEILVNGRDNTIDDNTVTLGVTGVRVLLSGNIITRNRASGNGTNYDIAAGNSAGTIQASPVGAGPWDNFTF